MSQSTTNQRLQIEFRLQNCSLTAERKEFLENHLGNIPRLVENFPSTRLHLDIHKHPRNGDFHIKMGLHLKHETLFTGSRKEKLMPAFNECVDKMVAEIVTHKRKLSGKHRWERERDPNI